MLPLLLSKKEIRQNKFLLLTYEILCSPLIFRMGVGIIAYFVSVLPYSRNNLSRCKISTNGNHKTKHSEASIKNLCLRGPSEFHLFFSLVSFRKLIHRICQKNKKGNSSDCKNNFGHQKTPKNSLPVAT